MLPYFFTGVATPLLYSLHNKEIWYNRKRFSHSPNEVDLTEYHWHSLNNVIMYGFKLDPDITECEFKHQKPTVLFIFNITDNLKLSS